MLVLPARWTRIWLLLRLLVMTRCAVQSRPGLISRTPCGNAKAHAGRWVCTPQGRQQGKWSALTLPSASLVPALGGSGSTLPSCMATTVTSLSSFRPATEQDMGLGGVMQPLVRRHYTNPGEAYPSGQHMSNLAADAGGDQNMPGWPGMDRFAHTLLPHPSPQPFFSILHRIP